MNLAPALKSSIHMYACIYGGIFEVYDAVAILGSRDHNISGPYSPALYSRIVIRRSSTISQTRIRRPDKGTTDCWNLRLPLQFSLSQVLDMVKAFEAFGLCGGSWQLPVPRPGTSCPVSDIALYGYNKEQDVIPDQIKETRLSDS